MRESQKPESPQPGVESGAACEPGQAPTGPPREAGGTTGEANLSPQQASRTGGATSGVGSDAETPSRSGTLPPDA